MVPGDNNSSYVAKEDFTIIMEKQWIQSLDEIMNSSIKQVDLSNDFPTIFKVPDYVRSYDPKAYDPVIVSLGPYHHQYHKDYAYLSLSLIQQVKLYYLKKFLKRNLDCSFADYIQMIKDMEMRVRNAYSELVMMSSDYFVRMMLLDCCFVLEVIISIFRIMEAEANNMRIDEDFKAELLVNPIISRRASRRRLMIDMLLLENQLPLFLLQDLYACLPNVDYLPPNFSSLMLATFQSMMPPCWSLNTDLLGQYHFLHLFHSSIISSIPSNLKNNETASPCTDHTPNGDLLRWVPSATQLQDAGVCFEKDEQKNLLRITFEGGRMKIPQLEVDEYTNTLFRNLIALEQCCPQHTDISNQLPRMRVEDQYFTMYATLMDCIINVDADVSLLQEKGIVISWLGNAGEVAQLFNNLVKGTSVCLKRAYLSTICTPLKEHCNTKYNRWKWKLNHDYLSSPWAGISLFGAVTLFLLTALQTTYTVLSKYN